MPLAAPKTLAPGTHAWLALENATLTLAGSVIKPAGDATSYTTVQRTAKPAATDGAWVKLSGIAKAELSVDNGQGLELWEPVPGGLELVEVLRVGRKRSFKLTCQRVQPITFQSLLQTLALNGSSTQFNPGEAPAELNAWLKIQVYDHKHALQVTLDHFVEFVLADALTLDPKAKTDPVYNATGLYSVLNTGTL
jgi:hypothetical protein